jgi:hypothetical protein
MRVQSQRTDSVYAEKMTNAGTVGAYIIAKVTMLRPTVALRLVRNDVGSENEDTSQVIELAAGEDHRRYA